MVTTILAIWGAILSTALAAWGIYKDLRDLDNVRVQAWINEWHERDEQNDLIFKHEVEIVLTNAGRRPVIVVSIGVGFHLSFWDRLSLRLGLSRAPSSFFEGTLDCGDVLPKRVEPGDFLKLIKDDLPVLKTMRCNRLFALDSLGRYHCLDRHAFERLLGQYQTS